MAKQAGIPKGKFKAKALEYFRRVEESRKPLVITDNGKPVLKIIPYNEDPESELAGMRGTVLKYTDPLEAVGLDDWEALQ